LGACAARTAALTAPSWASNLNLPIEARIMRFLQRPGIEPAALGHREACCGYRLYQLSHRDPADWLLIATAIELDCPLVTHDERIPRLAADLWPPVTSHHQDS
jgi:PIN domain nuclease of toxin-antitoxin system